ncbi:MAG: GTP pyrophosphokinase [Clostridia bacterium]|nr:GTP pyrophosphokinase [Clostridia bacterium]
MIYTALTKKAMKICFNAHKEQLDKGGMSYVFHPFHLAEQMDDELSTVAALLHDVAEDTDITIEMFSDMGIPSEVTDALKLLTHRENVPYLEYIREIKKNEIARKVKLADLVHNSDTARLETVDEKAKRRLEKYNEAVRLLQERL